MTILEEERFFDEEEKEVCELVHLKGLLTHPKVDFETIRFYSKTPASYTHLPDGRQFN